MPLALSKERVPFVYVSLLADNALGAAIDISEVTSIIARECLEDLKPDSVVMGEKCELVYRESRHRSQKCTIRAMRIGAHTWKNVEFAILDKDIMKCPIECDMILASTLFKPFMMIDQIHEVLAIHYKAPIELNESNDYSSMAVRLGNPPAEYRARLVLSERDVVLPDAAIRASANGLLDIEGTALVPSLRPMPEHDRLSTVGASLLDVCGTIYVDLNSKRFKLMYKTPLHLVGALKEMATEKGDPGAMRRLGDIHVGAGRMHNPNNAHSLWSQATKLGDAGAALRIAEAKCEARWGYSLDHAGAFRLLVPFVDSEYPGIARIIGVLYLRGWGVDKDYQKAELHFRRGISLGDLAACVDYDIVMEASGDPVKQKDGFRALLWAARRGNAFAQCNIGLSYVLGKGVTVNTEEGLRWYLKAAESQLSQAYINLGYFYEKGRAGTVDFNRATMWFEKALAAGHPDAASSIERVRALILGQTK